MDPALPVSGRRIGGLIERVDTPDERTLVIHWKATYPFANAINQDELGPLPTHILQSAYEADKSRLESHPYWKREFVGTGPYRLVQWEPGSHIAAEAYERFYAGKPKIDSVVFRFIPDGSTALANFMAGHVDGSLEAIDLNQVVFAREEMLRAGRQPTALLVPTHWRMVSMQFKPEVVRPVELLDVRARRGLYHAIDRQALADTVMAGTSSVAETFITPTDPRWEWVKDVVVPHPYDPRQARQLLEAVGWRRGGDGRFVDGAGQPISIALWTTSGEQNESETNIVADYWRQLGLGVEQTIISQAQQRDRRLRASYPGFDTTSVPLRFDNTTGRVHGAECPTVENDWVGSNRGCYRNPAMDRAIEALRGAIDPPEQRRWYREVVQLQMQELPMLSTYFNIHADIFREGVTGIRASSYLVRVPWNIAEWDIR
jgi:peptide/nickel transport system substrate-binding protein